MSQGPLCPNLSQKVQKEVSQMANRNFSRVILLGGLSVNLNHLKIGNICLRTCHQIVTLTTLVGHNVPGERKVPTITLRKTAGSC